MQKKRDPNRTKRLRPSHIEDKPSGERQKRQLREKKERIVCIHMRDGSSTNFHAGGPRLGPKTIVFFLKKGK